MFYGLHSLEDNYFTDLRVCLCYFDIEQKVLNA